MAQLADMITAASILRPPRRLRGDERKGGPRIASVHFPKPSVAWILMRASAVDSRGVTTLRKRGRRRGPERRNLHGRAGRCGKKRRADLAWRGREDLRPSDVGGSRKDKGPQQRSSQKERAICFHAAQIYDRSKRNVSPELDVTSPPTTAARYFTLKK
jgi:hypothetical protein